MPGKQTALSNTMSNDAPESQSPIERQLRALVASQEAKLSEIADLVANVRHDINNPLTGVMGQAQLLLRMDLPPDIRQRIESIEQLAIRIRDTTALLRNIQTPQSSVNFLNNSGSGMSEMF